MDNELPRRRSSLAFCRRTSSSEILVEKKGIKQQQRPRLRHYPIRRPSPTLLCYPYGICVPLCCFHLAGNEVQSSVTEKDGLSEVAIKDHQLAVM